MKVVTFGEILLRLSAPGHYRLFQKDNLEATFCGAEANVAASLAMFGLDTRFVTKLPKNDVGVAALRALNYFGVDTSQVIYGDGRVGLYYLEKGMSQRPSKVIYDRAYSAISQARPEEFDWEKIFQDATWFHWTGINPALSESVAEICTQACREAKQRGLVISCDLNYRSNLWTCEMAQRVMKKLMPYVDVCIANEEDAEKVLGIAAVDSDVNKGQLSLSGYHHVAEEICDQFGCKYVAITMRKSFSASRNCWKGLLYDNASQSLFVSDEYDIEIVDRVGGGDSFTAGIIYSMIMKMEHQAAIDFATAASCLKHTIEGDFNRVSTDDVVFLMRHGGNGRIVR